MIPPAQIPLKLLSASKSELFLREINSKFSTKSLPKLSPAMIVFVSPGLSAIEEINKFFVSNKNFSVK